MQTFKRASRAPIRVRNLATASFRNNVAESLISLAFKAGNAS